MQGLPFFWCPSLSVHPASSSHVNPQQPGASALHLGACCVLLSVEKGFYCSSQLLWHCEMVTLSLLPWKTQLHWSNRASKPANVQVPWQSSSANPALVREQLSCVVRNWLQCLWGITISLKMIEKGESGLCRVGSYKGCPSCQPLESQCEQELAAGVTGPGRRNVFGNKQLVLEDRAVEILESWISKDLL